jgi:hypothetical protein
MVTFNRIQAQLVKVDAAFANLGIADVKSLARVLRPNEQIVSCLKGIYNGSQAILCATDKRILLLRSKNQSTQINELSYDSVVSTKRSEKSWSSYIHVSTIDQTYSFKSLRKRQSKALYEFIARHSQQMRVMAEQSKPNYSIPKKFAHYTHVRSMRALGDTALVNML